MSVQSGVNRYFLGVSLGFCLRQSAPDSARTLNALVSARPQSQHEPIDDGGRHHEMHIRVTAPRRMAVCNTAMALQVDDGAPSEIASAGFDPVPGARPQKRTTQAQIEDLLAKAILEGRFAPKVSIHVS
jgi:murein endopeptidase